MYTLTTGWFTRVPTIAGVATLAFASAVGCGGSNAGLQAHVPGRELRKCTPSATPSTQPLVIELPGSERGLMDEYVHRGRVVVVRYSGCDMHVLSECNLPSVYEYKSGTIQAENVSIKNADDLYAQIPMADAEVEGRLAKGEAIRVSTNTVGRLGLRSETRPKPADVSTACKGATHIVTGITVGAYQMSSRASGAGGDETFQESGHAEHCKSSQPSDAMPPNDCSAMLRVELEALK